MRSYVQPRIAVITLDSAQAILQTCATAGIYVNPTRNYSCFTGSAGPYTLGCVLTVRGAGTAGVANLNEYTVESAPS